MLFVRKECQDKLPCRYLLLDGGRAASWRADHEDTEQGYTLPNPHLKNTEKTEGERECMRVCVRIMVFFLQCVLVNSDEMFIQTGSFKFLSSSKPAAVTHKRVLTSV